MTPEVLSKTEFAGLVGVTPTRVGQWIRHGQIGPDEMEGEGRFARIRVGPAAQKLKLRLDQGQRLGNGFSTNLNLEAAPTAAPNKPPAATDDIGEQLRLGKLEQQRYALRALHEAEMARKGLYTLTADVAPALAKQAAAMVAVFEGALADLAGAVAAKFQLPQRDVLHLLRAEFRTVRANAAQRAADQAAATPAHIAASDEDAPATVN